MRESTAAAIGFFVAPLVAAVLLSVASPLASDSSAVSFALVPIFYCFGFLACGFLAFPAFLVLRKYGLVRWWSATLAGAVVGSVVAVGLAAPRAAQLSSLVLLGTVGMCAGFTFYAIWRVGRAAPNPSFKRTPEGAA